MNFALSEEQQLVRQMARQFAEEKVKPIAGEIDETEEFPMENAKLMGKYGLMGIPFQKNTVELRVIL